MESIISDLSRGTSNHDKMKLEEQQSSYHLRSVVHVIQYLVMVITEQLFLSFMILSTSQGGLY